MKITACIPARLNSSRLPNKPLIDFEGEPMIKVVVSRLMSFELFDQIFVVTDSNEISQAVSDCDCNVIISKGNYNSGTQRISSVLNEIDGDIIINVQCDEPVIPKSYVIGLYDLMRREEVRIGTICHRIEDAETLFDYNKVKVVFDNNKRVIYFSRQAIPAHRDALYENWIEKSPYYQHVGIYGFKRDALARVGSLQPLYLEKAEMLEQLNWMQHGCDVHLGLVEKEESVSVDTIEDLERAIQIYINHLALNK